MRDIFTRKMEQHDEFHRLVQELNFVDHEFFLGNLHLSNC